MRHTIDLLRDRCIALVSSDAPGWQRLDTLTTDFAYARLHGARELYTSGYSEAELDAWDARIRSWSAQGALEVFVYFDNDARAHAPFDALALARRLAGVHRNP